MALYVNTNVTSLNGQRYLSNVQNSLNTTYQRLSSGLRINSAKDDAAGLQIADRMTTQINGLTQGNRNSSDAIALAQTIEGGMDEISSMLQSIRTLAVQAANGTNTDSDRESLTQQASAYVSEINRIASQTKFGGKTVLNGGAAYNATADNVTLDTNSIYGDKVAGQGSARYSGIIKFQVGANNGDNISLTVQAFNFSSIAQNADTNFVANAGGLIAAVGGKTQDSDLSAGTLRFSLTSVDNASAAISTLDKMINTVDKQRGALGSIQNRLESTIRNQSNVAANQTDARSRIQDADFAQESANLSQQSIIQQAASAMLTQANARPQLALSLLG